MIDEEILVVVEVVEMALEDSEAVVEAIVEETLVEVEEGSTVKVALTEVLTVTAVEEDEPLVISNGLPHCQIAVLLSRMTLIPYTFSVPRAEPTAQG
jgi:hypothetical protein